MMEVNCRTAPTVAENLAVDESLARTASATRRHKLRFWCGGPPAVVMGFSECDEQVANLDNCARCGVGLAVKAARQVIGPVNIQCEADISPVWHNGRNSTACLGASAG